MEFLHVGPCARFKHLKDHLFGRFEPGGGHVCVVQSLEVVVQDDLLHFLSAAELQEV